MSDDRSSSESIRRHLASLRRGAVGSFRRTARIARWEISRSAGTVDRRTIVAVAAILVVVGGVGLSVAEDGIGLEDELYVVGVDSDDPYADVATESDRFRTIALEDVRIDEGGDSNVDVVVTRDGELGYVGDNGEQAFHAFREAIEAENADRMAAEDDDVAAYPVLVTVEYQERETGMAAESGDGGSDTGGDVIGTDGVDADESAADDDTEIVDTDGDTAVADSDTTSSDSEAADSGGDRALLTTIRPTLPGMWSVPTGPDQTTTSGHRRRRPTSRARRRTENSRFPTSVPRQQKRRVPRRPIRCHRRFRFSRSCSPFCLSCR